METLQTTHAGSRTMSHRQPVRAPLLSAATTATIRGGTRRSIDPAHHRALHQIYVHAMPKIPGPVAVGTPPKGRAKIVPVGRPAGIPRGVVGFPPHKEEGFRAHPDPGPAPAYRPLIPRGEGLEALHQAQL